MRTSLHAQELLLAKAILEGGLREGVLQRLVPCVAALISISVVSVHHERCHHRFEIAQNRRLKLHTRPDPGWVVGRPA